MGETFNQDDCVVSTLTKLWLNTIMVNEAALGMLVYLALLLVL